MSLYEDNPEEILIQMEFKRIMEIQEAKELLERNGYVVIKNN